jgi:mRNA-degrading endonuclease RelE of RelBE toxin-antitoxin system
MASKRVVAVQGLKLTVEWAVDFRGRTPALDFFKELSREDRQKVLALFKRLADTGDISNREHFKSLGKQGQGLWEFKRFQLRFLGDYRLGRRFLVALGLRKKKDDLNDSDVERAVRILSEHDERERLEAKNGRQGAHNLRRNGA